MTLLELLETLCTRDVLSTPQQNRMADATMRFIPPSADDTDAATYRAHLATFPDEQIRAWVYRVARSALCADVQSARLWDIWVNELVRNVDEGPILGFGPHEQTETPFGFATDALAWRALAVGAVRVLGQRHQVEVRRLTNGPGVLAPGPCLMRALNACEAHEGATRALCEAVLRVLVTDQRDERLRAWDEATEATKRA